MTCKIPEVVEQYLVEIESGKYRVSDDVAALAEYIRRIFATEDLVFYDDRCNKYLGLAKYFYFAQLFPWEKFLIALWLCTYTADGLPRWKQLFAMIGRGAGKDGFIAFAIACLLSPYNPAARYNVDICAVNEEQATQPIKDLVEVLENPKNERKLSRYYYHTKEFVQGNKNRGVAKGRTNNSKGRDGMRSSLIVFNEVHAYQNYDNITVFTTGQGKGEDPRALIVSSNGNVNDGPLDDYLAQAKGILFDGEQDDGFLPFVCRLNEKDQVHDQDCWTMANPSLPYLPHLMQEIKSEYSGWIKKPEQNSDFLTKRMGIRSGFKEISVTDYDKITATNKPVPDLTGKPCTVGIDYAEMNDWASVNLHFVIDKKRYDISHSWICTQSKTLHRVQAPWRKWAKDELCTVVDEPTIRPRLLTDYIRNAAMRYQIRKLALDRFRFTLLADDLKQIGFDGNDKSKVKLISTSDIMRVDPVIQSCFDLGLFYWGDCPPLRWAVNNTKRVRSSKNIGSDTGNFYYAKIEAKSRKTDPFMALVASMVVEDAIPTTLVANGLPPIGAFVMRG